MKVLITGSNGMVARSTAAYCRSAGDEVIALSRADLDIADIASVRDGLTSIRPDTVINCAAYTDVDGAEANASTSYSANADGPENLAIVCREIDAGLVTISTDYVFDGSFAGYYDQRHTPEPNGVYARSKLEGELRVRAANARAFIVRSGWIFGHGGTNFLSVMPALLREGRAITAIDDAWGTPTFADDLARRLRELAELDLPCTFHVTNSGGGTSYHGFALEVCSAGGFDPSLVTPVAGSSLSRPAPRPRNSKLACLFSERFGLEPLPDWTDAVKRFCGSY
ncbi:MAG: dTDP-4-dehydrorhamnose reductase [Pyrinomonadaceae bacterium]|nr:dTDP-4-dehydrorhamnose reductase [Pyrinomonadaceae bacterium]